MSNKLQGHEYIAHTLKAYEVSHIFYIEAILRMAMREMEKQDIKCIMAHSENGAGYMADGFARATGKPGVVMAQSIGAGNLAGGIYDAYLSNSPLIAITGKKTPTFQYKNAYQETDHRLLFEGITKFNAEIVEANQIPYLLRQCFREATTGKPKPIHLDITNQMGRTMEMATVDEPLYFEEAYITNPAYRPSETQSKIDEAIALIHSAKKPVILAGRGAKVSGAEKEIYDFATLNDIPIVTTPDGRTIVDETDAIWAGNSGAYGMDCANRAMLNSDLVIFIGTQASDQTTIDWTCPSIDTKVIQIDIDPAEIGRCYPNTFGLMGDAKTVVRQLLHVSSKTKRTEWRSEVAGYVKNTFDEYKVSQEMNNTPIKPERLCHEISKVLPDDAVIVADTGYSAQWTITMLRLKATHRYFRAAGSLGWSFPGSMGIKLGLPNNPVICFAGDGAMYYHLGEMETMARYGIKTVTIVNNNQALAQCSGDLRKVHSENEERAKTHYEFTPTRFSEIAKSFGLNGVVVEKPEDIGPAIIKALKEDKSTIIDVITDPEASVPAPLKK
jgi:acetolactate synthase-1/2/3 large subunit